MDKKINIIYLISNNSKQLYKIENSKKIQEYFEDDYEVYEQYFDCIIDNIIDKNFKTNKYLKTELIINNNSIVNTNYEIFNIYIEKILSLREITEIDDLNILNEQFNNILTNYDNKDNIIIVEYKFIKHIKYLLQKEKIHKKIYFTSDFGKPISFMLKEFYNIIY